MQPNTAPNKGKTIDTAAFEGHNIENAKFKYFLRPKGNSAAFFLKQMPLIKTCIKM